MRISECHARGYKHRDRNSTMLYSLQAYITGSKITECTELMQKQDLQQSKTKLTNQITNSGLERVIS